MKSIACALWCAVLLAAAPKTETGEINGAKFRIDVPENWSGVLVLFCHGYSANPGSYNSGKPSAAVQAFLSQGAALAQSGYAAGGWAIEEAMQDTQALRRYFIRTYGAPKETYVTGFSMGGFLTMTLLETFPNEFDGGLAMCGPLAPASTFMMRRVFDMRVVFDYYFPGALPPPDKVPADYQLLPALNAKMQALLDAKPAAADAFRRYSGIANNKEAAATVVFFTYILKDLQQRGGGNPFDNRNTIYENPPDSDALNDGVARYTASPRAAEYVRTWYTPTGRLTRPMLAMHTTYDPLVPPWVTNTYSALAAQAGAENMFVQQYVKHPGHCAFEPQELIRGFLQLREWKQTGKRPLAGLSR